jgi:hypothetical protein
MSALSVSNDERYDAIRKVADAVLYEGYVLYPYRASSAKNQFRWQFGVLAPRGFVEAAKTEAWRSRTETVLVAERDTEVRVHIRFLQVQARLVEALHEGAFELVPELEARGEIWTTWEEAIEHEVHLGPLVLGDLVDAAHEAPFEIDGGSEEETLFDARRTSVGRVLRRRWPLSARVTIDAEEFEGPFRLMKLGVSVENTADWDEGSEREKAVQRSLVAAHVAITADGGKFISLFDPPEYAKAIVGRCENVGCFPVLASKEGCDDAVLSSPIILYDYPEIAPESQGDMCDGTEIDEILALRILTLTDAEKRQARSTDPRSAAIIDQCDEMSPEVFDRLHGAIRSLDFASDLLEEEVKVPWWDPAVDESVDPTVDSVMVGGAEVRKGTRVRLHPGSGGDAQDIFLENMTALVTGVFYDVDDQIHVAVVLEDDPASELHEWYGRYRYFRPDELEVEGSPP